MNNPLISVIIPVYNSEKYLAECIDSILSQTYKNIEIILVNDGSKDNSLNICKQYQTKYHNIITIDKKNGGASSARNVGIDNANGDFIMFVDSDDYIAPNMLETLYGYYTQTSADVIGSQLSKVTNQKVFLKTVKKISHNKEFSPEQIIKRLFVRTIDCSPCTKLIKRTAIGNLRFIEGVTEEDIVFLFQLYPQCNKIYYTTKSFYFYRENFESVTHNITMHSYDVFKNMLYIEQQLPNTNFDLTKEFFVYKNKVALDVCYSIIRNKVRAQYSNIYQQCRQIVYPNKYRIIFNNYMSYKYTIKLIISLLNP